MTESASRQDDWLSWAILPAWDFPCWSSKNQSINRLYLRGEHVTVSETDDPVALYKIKLKK